MRTLNDHEDTAELAVELEGTYGLSLDAALLVKFKYYAAIPGDTDGPGGPPIEPDTDASVEIHSVSLKIVAPDGKGAFITPLKADAYDATELQQRCIEYVHEG
jgi:hypothetical protein